MSQQKNSVFPDLSADKYHVQASGDDEDDQRMDTQEIESLCMNCQENGITRLLLTRIPHYKEVIIMSFNCDNCGFTNNEIQPGGKIQERGVQVKVLVKDERDLNRQIVKGDSAVITVPEIDLEIPVDSQKGAISTIEGVLDRVVAGLEQDQPVRKHMDPEGAKQIEEFVEKIKSLKKLENPFHLILRDPSGNSFVENLHAPGLDPQREVTSFQRTLKEDHELGIYTQEEISAVQDGAEMNENNKKEEENGAGDAAHIGRDEVLKFPTNCPDCNAPAETNMKMTEIPHFKEVVIMATNCDFCGHKTNEVKSGGGIEPLGTKITLKVTDPSDLNRDVLKSETCNLILPDLEFEMGGYAVGGRFTTLEGILNNILEKVESNPFLGTTSIGGDSTTREAKEKLKVFTEKVRELMTGEKPFVFVLDDPSGNSYLQNLYAPDDDPEMTIERYERTFEQNDDLGINDMKVENYGEKETAEKLDLAPAQVTPMQAEQLTELSSSAQSHIYTKDSLKSPLLSPAHALNANDDTSRRVSSARSAKSELSGAANSTGGGGDRCQ